MSASDSKSDPTGATAPPAERGETGEVRRSNESWLDRIRNAVGFKSGSIRTDLETALASNDVTAAFTPEERSMLGNILRLREMRVDDIMVPRADIEAVSVDLTLAELFAAFRKSGHSRMPVYRETLDDPIGLVHIRDLMDLITDAARAAGRTPGEEAAAGADGVQLALDRVDQIGRAHV